MSDKKLESILRGLKRMRGRHRKWNKAFETEYNEGWFVGFECAVDYVERRMKKGRG